MFQYKLGISLSWVINAVFNIVNIYNRTTPVQCGFRTKINTLLFFMMNYTTVNLTLCLPSGIPVPIINTSNFFDKN